MAVRGGSRTLPPPMPAEIHRAPCVTFLEFEIKMGQGHRCRCGGRGGTPQTMPHSLRRNDGAACEHV